MSVPKTMSPIETVALINLSSLTVEEEKPTLTTAQPRPALPSRVACRELSSAEVRDRDIHDGPMRCDPR